MDIILLIVMFGLGAAFGLMAYRYWLARDPESLEAWAQRIKAKTRG